MGRWASLNLLERLMAERLLLLGLLEVLRKVSVWPKDLYSFDVAVTGGRKGQSNALR